MFQQKLQILLFNYLLQFFELRFLNLAVLKISQKFFSSFKCSHEKSFAISIKAPNKFAQHHDVNLKQKLTISEQALAFIYSLELKNIKCRGA